MLTSARIAQLPPISGAVRLIQLTNWLYVCETRSAYHFSSRKFTTMSTTYHDVDVRGGSSAPKRCVKILISELFRGLVEI